MDEGLSVDERESLIELFFAFHGWYAELNDNYMCFMDFIERILEEELNKNFNTTLKISKRIDPVKQDDIDFIVAERLSDNVVECNKKIETIKGDISDYINSRQTYRWDFRDEGGNHILYVPAMTDTGYFVVDGEEKVILIQETRFKKEPYVKENNGIISCECNIGDSYMPLTIVLHKTSHIYINTDVIHNDIHKIQQISVSTFLRHILRCNSEEISNAICMSSIDKGVFDDSVIYTLKAILETSNDTDDEIILENKTEILDVIRKKLFFDMPNDCILFTIINMASNCIRVMLNKQGTSDRDSYVLKRLVTPGETIFTMFKCSINATIRQYNSRVRRKNVINFLNTLQDKFDNLVINCLKRGEYTIKKIRHSKIAVQLSKRSHIDRISSVRKVQVPCDENSKNIDMRQIHPSQKYFICPCETPEGKTVGIVKHLASLCLISPPSSGDTYAIKSIPIKMLPLGSKNSYLADKITMIEMNGATLGWCMYNDAIAWIDIAKKLHLFVSCSITRFPRLILKIRSGNGRPIIPVVNLRSIIGLKEVLNLNMDKLDKWKMLVSNGYILYYDTLEFDNNTGNIDVIHPCTMLGLTASMIPFPSHNQSARNVFACAMLKQAVQMSGHEKNCFVLQKPIVSTEISRVLKFGEEYPYGINLITCILSLDGFNEEDAIIINKSCIDRGVFNFMVYKTLELYVEDPFYCVKDKDGIISVIYGITEQQLCYMDPLMKNPRLVSCTKSPYAETYHVSNAWKLEVTYKEDRRLSIGDKLTSRHGQKGVVGMIFEQEDMPFNMQGITPDIIINPHAIPSRMTVGQLLEGVLGVSFCKSPSKELQDGTPFIRKGIAIQDVLNINSTEKLTLGTTGEMIDVPVYMGMVYYMALQQHSIDKIYVRSTGPRSLMSRQPVSGKSKSGGLRFGEMEYDCLIAHGASKLVTSISENSDMYEAPYCHNCLIFHNVIGSNCNICGNPTKIRKVPFSFLVFNNMMLAANMSVKIRFD